MISEIKDLVAHMVWADNEIWKEIFKLDTQKDIHEIHNLMLHIHSCQFAYHNIWNNQPLPNFDKIKFQSLHELYNWGIDLHKKNLDFINNLKEQNLDDTITLPWIKIFEDEFGKPPEKTNLKDTIHQVIMHSTYHRGQVNLKIRSLENKPPLIDYIYWIWLGKPLPEYF